MRKTNTASARRDTTAGHHLTLITVPLAKAKPYSRRARAINQVSPDAEATSRGGPPWSAELMYAMNASPLSLTGISHPSPAHRGVPRRTYRPCVRPKADVVGVRHATVLLSGLHYLSAGASAGIRDTRYGNNRYWRTVFESRLSPGACLVRTLLGFLLSVSSGPCVSCATIKHR